MVMLLTWYHWYMVMLLTWYHWYMVMLLTCMVSLVYVLMQCVLSLVYMYIIYFLLLCDKQNLLYIREHFTRMDCSAIAPCEDQGICGGGGGVIYCAE